MNYCQRVWKAVYDGAADAKTIACRLDMDMINVYRALQDLALRGSLQRVQRGRYRAVSFPLDLRGRVPGSIAARRYSNQSAPCSPC